MGRDEALAGKGIEAEVNPPHRRCLRALVRPTRRRFPRHCAACVRDYAQRGARVRFPKNATISVPESATATPVPTLARQRQRLHLLKWSLLPARPSGDHVLTSSGLRTAPSKARDMAAPPVESGARAPCQAVTAPLTVRRAPPHFRCRSPPVDPWPMPTGRPCMSSTGARDGGDCAPPKGADAPSGWAVAQPNPRRCHEHPHHHPPRPRREGR